ncbi:hypothetical protein JR316_0009302 [Psilocybe cubensis]|uniref:Uncharacterized protein n=2 Tax=Psilocybe cubensis TaxID=181762 RepID=A0ACB8GSY3_PSICU|nr:hypothetical protein JR316_0009302 [Psilocybe cubensis]KAH9478840.1 hypothetical protein JR316_0009302 [Psilocybe cubensis]
MKFTSISSLVLAAVSSALAVQAAPPIAQSADALSIIFYDDINFVGNTYSPINAQPDTCIDLPSPWRNRAESMSVGSGYTCTFYSFTGCQGAGKVQAGRVATLPTTGNPVLYQNIESFECTSF